MSLLSYLGECVYQRNHKLFCSHKVLALPAINSSRNICSHLTLTVRGVRGCSSSMSSEASFPGNSMNKIDFNCVHACVLSSSVMCDSWQPKDYSSPGSSVHGILQARIMEWVAISSSRGLSWPRDQTRISCVSCIAGRFFIMEPWGKPFDCLSYVYISPN